MHRLTMMAGALCAALMMSTGAFAQMPPNPNNPNDTVPDVMPFTPPYGEPINLETAKKVAAAADAEAKKRN
jgi:glc operon protein GlcG